MKTKDIFWTIYLSTSIYIEQKQKKIEEDKIICCQFENSRNLKELRVHFFCIKFEINSD